MQKTQELEVQNSEYFIQTSEKKREKDLLLEEYDEVLHSVKNISFKNLLTVFLAIFLVLLLLLPKIYISNQIYYTSKNINTMYHTYTALQEEHAHLQRELELIHYQVEVLDELEAVD